MPALRKQLERFAQEFVKHLNATQAAKDAGYSKKTARQKGSQLLSKVNVQARIAELNKDRVKRTKVSQDHVITELSSIAFSDISNFLHWESDGKIVVVSSDQLNALKKGFTRQIESISRKKDGTFEIKLHPKLPALRLLAEHTKVVDPTQTQIRKVYFNIEMDRV